METANNEYERLLDAATEHHWNDERMKPGTPADALVRARIAATSTVLSSAAGRSAYLATRERGNG